MLNQSVRRAWRFFHENAGYVVGQRAMGAWALVKAEEYAAEQDWEWEWEWDDWQDHPRDWGWSEADIKRWEMAEHTHECCVLRDARGNILASLGGIWDASRSYRRVVEVELALEAMKTVSRIRPTFGIGKAA